jgi:hypothetical protein
METSGSIVSWFSAGSLTANVISGGLQGVNIGTPSTVSSNTVANSRYGIVASGGITATSNKISNAFTGIYDLGGGNTYKSNAITKTGVGIEFACNTATVLSNTINDATTGLDHVPSSFSGANSFNNVVTLRTDGCGFRPTPPAAPVFGSDARARPLT